MPAPPKTFKNSGYLTEQDQSVFHGLGAPYVTKFRRYIPGTEFSRHGQVWVNENNHPHRTDGPAKVTMAFTTDFGMELETWANGHLRRNNLNLVKRDGLGWREFARATANRF